MEFYRFAELAIYSILRFLPLLLLLLYIFRNNLRFPLPVTIAAIILLTCLRIGCGIYPYFLENQADLPNPGIVPLALIGILFIKAHFGKSLFTILMLANLSDFTNVAAKCAEGLFFPSLALEFHRLSNSLTLLIVEAIVLIPLFFYIKKIYVQALFDNTTTSAWGYLWLIPFTLYAVSFRNNFYSAEGQGVLALRPSHLLFSFLVNAGGILIYTMVTLLIAEQRKNTLLRDKEHLLRLQHTQYSNLQDKIEEARRAKHDLRQHLRVISAYANDKKYDELQIYLAKYAKTLPEDDKISYCENYAVNALLQYFYGYAKMIGSGFSAEIRLTKDAGIPDETLAVVLGNLLENAVEACTKEGAGSVISVRGKMDENAIFFKIINTCTEKPKTDKKGKFFSSKREGYGIGLQSVSDIAKQYGGIMKSHWEDGKFTVSIMLNIPQV